MENNQVKITGLTVGYVAWYKEHYCLVKVSALQFLILDENGGEVLSKVPKNTQECIDEAPQIVSSYIEQKYFSDKKEG